MRHVDEGTIHAWLDQQVTDPQEVARITAHLRECATCHARVAAEEVTIRDAEALLSSVAPVADGSREAFEALIASAAHRNGTGARATSASTSTKSGSSYSWWIVSAGWAATIALAIGIGWSARYLMSPRSPVEQPAASPVPPQMARAEAPPAQSPDDRGQDTSAETAAKTAQSSRVTGTRRMPAAAVEERVRPAPSATQSAEPDATGQGPVELETSRSVPSLIALVPSPPPSAEPPTALAPPAAPPFALPFRAESVEVTAEAPVVDVQNARQRAIVPGSPATAEAPATLATPAASPPPPAPAPPAVAPAAGGGRGGGVGRGGGGGGGRGGGRAAGTPPVTAGAVGQVAAGATDGLNQGPIPVDGLLINRTETADGIDWLVVSREAARERSRMSLYGIDGLTPARTMVNADGSKVRTVYVVNAAEVVLLQERQAAPPFLTGAGVAPAADPQPAAGLVRWSARRGDVVLTVQGVDAAVWGARVRLD
jgi:hypothetical protein